MPWFNPDGLRVYFAGELRAFDGGEYPSAGSIRVIEWEVPATSIGATSTVFGAPFVIIPRNSVIDSVEVQSETALTSGGAATLNVGIVRMDGTTEYDFDGLVAALPLANLNVAGEKNVLSAGQTNAGALVGVETAYPGYLSVDYDTAAYTAGKILVRLRIYVKDEDLLVNNW